MTSCYTPDRIPGGVAESADAPDLKSGSFGSVGSSPTAPTNELPAKEHFYTDGRKPPVIGFGGFGSNAAAVGYDRASSIAAAAWFRMFGSTWE